LKPQAAARAQERSISRIPVHCITPGACQPRQSFSDDSLAELAESIRQHGLLSPLLVRRIAPERYELIAGERRLRALKLLGRSHADVIVMSAFDRDCALIALVENLQRENLHYLDEAAAFRNILDIHGVTQEKLARSLSISASALANRLRLLKLSETVRHALRQYPLTERHARALLRLTDETQQLSLIQEAFSRRMSVKQMEARVEQLLRTTPVPQPRCGAVRDNRIVINAVLDTVRELNRIGVHADSRVEEVSDGVQVIVTIRTPPPNK